MLQAIEDIDDLFATKKKDIYLKDSNTVDPRRVVRRCLFSRFQSPPGPRCLGVAAFCTRLWFALLPRNSSSV